MPGEDAAVIKERIISLLKTVGPSIPIKIAKDVGSNTLFTSAFLSELLEEKRLLMSNMRVGSSPLFFIPGQEAMLENFSNNLKSKEREAFILLKEKKFLKDSEQAPAIRVAIREIKDFAFPFESNGLHWRFLTIPESDFKVEKEKKIEPAIEKEIITEHISTAPIIETVKVRKVRRKRKTSKKSVKDDEFLLKIKNTLTIKSIEILELLHHVKDEVVLRIKEGEEKILVAYNKKKLTEKDIIKAAKRAKEKGLPFKILSHGELPKKTKDLMEVLKGLSSVDKIE